MPNHQTNSDTSEILVDVSEWSDSSRQALEETVEGLAHLEDCIGDGTAAATYLSRFRRSMLTLVRDLRRRDLIEPQ